MTKDAILLSRGDVRGVAALDDAQRLWAITNRRLTRIDATNLDPTSSTRAARVLTLHKGERVLGFLDTFTLPDQAA